MREFFGRRFSITLNAEKNLHPADCCDTLAVKEIQERKRKWQKLKALCAVAVQDLEVQ